MAITEDERFELHQGLIRALGRERAATMMAMLPPVGWADVATKDDLHQLEARLDVRFETLEARLDVRFETLEARLDGRIDRFDARFDTLSDRFDARLERELRELEHRVFNRMVLILGVFATLQTAVLQLLR